MREGGWASLGGTVAPRRSSSVVKPIARRRDRHSSEFEICREERLSRPERISRLNIARYIRLCPVCQKRYIIVWTSVETSLVSCYREPCDTTPLGHHVSRSEFFSVRSNSLAILRNLALLVRISRSSRKKLKLNNRARRISHSDFISEGKEFFSAKELP